MSEVPRNRQAFIAQENTRLKDENEQLSDEVRSLRAFVQSLDYLYNAVDHFKDDSELLPFLKQTLQRAMKLLNTQDGSLALLDDEKNELVFVIVHGSLSDTLTDYRMPADKGIAGWVVQHARPAFVRNAQTDPRFYNTVDQDFTFKTQSIAAAPLIGDRRVYGLIEVLNQPGDEPFSDDDVALLRLLCRAAGEALADIDRTTPSS